ncbi:hypothetical protein [uncultured Paraglaciecola sp.]|uniref:hypothetical protein n=1 Tax=uncultured Paraglaciecola sp. TaxID=1765024 RepID=UPI002610625B|nr:hypothetical protein [uncultured Paraglaciecola sp.]
MSELETFLDDDPVEEPKVETAEETTEQSATTEESTAELAPEKEPDVSPAETQSEDKIPIAALLDEREKRQAAQRELEQLRKQVQPKEDKTPDVLDDQEGFVKTIRNDVQQAIINERANISEHHARQKHDDFDTRWVEVERFIAEKGLGNDVVNHVDPYGHAFKLYDDHLEMQRLKDPGHMEKIRAELREELRAEILSEKGEIDAKADAKAKLEATLTPSLANQRSEGSVTAAQPVADPLETTFNR